MKRVKFLITFLPAIILLFAFVSPVSAETKTLNVTKDTYANKAYPDTPKGNVGSVIVSNKFTDRLGYLLFNNPDLPEGAIVDRGILKFYVHELHYSDRAKLNVGPLTGDWEENTLTWNNKPTINQTQAIEAEIALDTAGWREITITHLVRQWHEGTAENKGIFIYPLGYLYGTAETEYAFSFKSRESGDQAAKLEIVYHFEPEPTPTSTNTPTPKPSPGISPAATASPPPEASPSPEGSPTAAIEATKEGVWVLNLTPGQAIIGGAILLALVGAVIAFATYFGRQDKEKKKKPKKTPEKEQENQEEV